MASDNLFRVSGRGVDPQRMSVPTGAETPASFLKVSQFVPFALNLSSMNRCSSLTYGSIVSDIRLVQVWLKSITLG